MRKLPTNLPYLPLLLVPFILLAPLILTGKAMFWGTPALQFVPWREFAWDILTDGHLPLWNPLVGMGAPLLANYQSALLYPPNWLLFVFDAIGGVGLAAWGQSILVWAHLTFAGIGMAKIGRRIGLNSLAQIITGLSFGLSGYMVARSGFLSINAAAAWLPWILLVTTGRFDKRALFHTGTIKISLLFALQFLAGHAQTAWYTILLAFFWSAITGWIVLPGRNDLRDGKYKGVILILYHVVIGWARILIGIILGFLLAAIQLLPTAEYLMQSQRSNAVAYEHALTYSFWPWRLITLFAPGMFGSPVQGNYWGYGNYWEDAIYIGLLPIVMMLGVIVGAIWSKVRRNHSAKESNTDFHGYSPLILLLFGLIIVSLLLALGNRTPIYPWLYHNIPTFSLFQAPTRITIWAEFSFALLAGIGVHIWRRPQGRGLYWARLGTAGAFAISLGSGVAWYFLGGISPTFIQATALAGFWGLCTGVLTLLAPTGVDTSNLQDSRRRMWSVSVVLVISLDLLLANWGLIPGIEKSFYSKHADNHEMVNSLLGEGRLYMPGTDEYSLKFDRFMRFKSFDIDEDWMNLRAVYLPNLSIFDDFSSANNFDPLVPSRFTDWMESLEIVEEATEPDKLMGLMNLMGVRLVEKKDTLEDFGVSFQVIPDAMRVRWVGCARFVPDKVSARELVFNEVIDYELEVVIETSRPMPNVSCAKENNRGRVYFVTDNPSHLVLESESTNPGWLVLSDVWYPGWQAKVDGVKVDIYKANYLFRAVYLEEGDHTIDFNYRPASFWWGVGLTSSTLLTLLLVWYYLVKPKNEPTIN